MEVTLLVGPPQGRDMSFVFEILEELRIAQQLRCPHLSQVVQTVLRGGEDCGDIRFERDHDRFGLRITLWRTDTATGLILFALAHYGRWETSYGHILQEPLAVLQEVEDGAETLHCSNITVVIND